MYILLCTCVLFIIVLRFHYCVHVFYLLLYYVSFLQVSSMVLHDAIQTLLIALHSLSNGAAIMTNAQLSCEKDANLEIGQTVYNYINSVSSNKKSWMQGCVG